MKNTTNLIELKKKVVYHFRAVIEKLKCIGLEKEEIDKIK